MRENIIELLKELSKGEKPFFGQDTLPKKYQDMCANKLQQTKDLKSLNSFFEDVISPIIFHSHNMYLAYK